jgi:hypothetical protein
MDDSSAEKAKARRAIFILYVVTFIGVTLPAALFFLLHHN